MSICLIPGDCRDVLPTLAADSVQCVVTSPPYYGLRDYGTALWDGGDANCQHAVAVNTDRTQRAAKNAIRDDALGAYAHPSGWSGGGRAMDLRQCSCGAQRIDRQIGLEATPDEYLATMVTVFREVRRVLHPTGTVFCNMGDSYSDKQLLLMPARLALALQADGWWVRSDIIWHKPNPMPESCTDRPTSAHEHVFLLTKSARYFYDADAVREPLQDSTVERGYTAAHLVNGGGAKEHANTDKMVRQGKGWWDNAYVPSGRNLRNVWTIATSPFSAAHFATFPPELAERCIRAGTSERGACSQCGKPWVRVTERTKDTSDREARGKALTSPRQDGSSWNEADGRGFLPITATTTGWQTGCKCDADIVPCTVLDPFAGAGTTLLCSDRLQRDAIGVELNTAYTEMAIDRCRADAPLFTSFPPAEDPEEARMGDLFAEAAE